MDNLESSILDLTSSIVEISKKREIRVSDLNELVRKSKDLQGCFTFAKKLMNEVSNEGNESLEKLRKVESDLKKEQESHQKDIDHYEDVISKLNEDVEAKNALLGKISEEKDEVMSKFNSMNMELSNAKESCVLLREELQKAYLTCTTYEEQIVRLNEQLSLETIEKQNKGVYYEKKVQDLEERMETMEEGMYDPEAYYCLERDRVNIVYFCNSVVFS